MKKNILNIFLATVGVFALLVSLGTMASLFNLSVFAYEDKSTTSDASTRTIVGPPVPESEDGDDSKTPPNPDNDIKEGGDPPRPIIGPPEPDPDRNRRRIPLPRFVEKILHTQNNTYDYDVVVVGAGTGGAATAIQAARMGSKVALLEETSWVGGQMTAAGVTSMDGGEANLERGGGIYEEFIDNVKTYYENPNRFPPSGKSIGTCYWRDWSICLEPKVGRQILEDMVNEAGVDIFFNKEISATKKTGNNITGVVMADGDTFNADVVVDATEYGDVIPLTGARYRVGNSLSTNINENSCVQSITYTSVMKKYPNGVPTELVIPYAPPGYEEAKSDFETIIAKDGNQGGKNYPYNWLWHVGYRGMPDSSNPFNYSAKNLDKITRTGVNWANDYPGGRIKFDNNGNTIGFEWNDTMKVSYLEDPTERKNQNCEAKLQTLNFLYYAQTELGESKWAIANDQGYSESWSEEQSCGNIPAEFKSIEKHFPVIPYVRESRRIVPVHTLTAKEIKRIGNPPRAATSFSSSVALGDYTTDLHNCNTDDTFESYLGEKASDGSKGGVFQIPFETLIPEIVDGFVAAEKNIGTTRLANGATRLQPVTMSVGQAAGAIASLASRGNIKPRDVRPVEVQDALLESKSAILMNKFEDIPVGHTFWKAVQIAVANAFVMPKSDTKFGVNSSVSRGDAAAILVSKFNLKTSGAPQETFVDVPVTSPYYMVVEALYQSGLTAGCSSSPKKYCPERPITRAQFITMLVGALGFSPDDASSRQVFEDMPSQSPYFPFVQIASDNNLTVGCSVSPRLFCPERPATRSQIAAFLSSSFLELNK